MSQYKDLLFEVRDGVARITINRPEKYNAFTAETCEELIDALKRAGWDKSVAVIVLTGAGDKAFCSGADLKERAARTTGAMVHDRLNFVAKWTTLVSSMRKPVIAAIKGYCMAGG